MGEVKKRTEPVLPDTTVVPDSVNRGLDKCCGCNTEDKVLDNLNTEDAKSYSDVQVYGDPDMWGLLCKASSEDQGWMKSTKGLDIPGVGVVLQVTTQQRNPDGSYSVAEALTFVPGAYLHDTAAGPKKITSM